MLDSSLLYSVGFALVFIGILILILATVLMTAKSQRKGKVKSAGIIVVGPVPIIFGSDKKSVKTILVLSVALTVLIVAAMIIYYFLLR